MNKIAVIDDNSGLRETLVNHIEDELKELAIDESVLSVFDIAPLSTIEEYTNWANREEVAAIILDEKLTQYINTKTHVAVNYNGHDAAVYIRKHINDMPLILITSIDSNDELQKAIEAEEDKLDLFCSREEFTKKIATYVSRISRMALKFSERSKDDLQQLTEISSRIALGQERDGDREQLGALRAKLDIGAAYDHMPDMKAWIAEAEDLRDKLKDALSKANNISQ
jgi:CheY-like chemotaxis protein